MNHEEPNLVQLLTNLSNACRSLAASLEVLAGHDQDHGRQLANHSAQLANLTKVNAGFALLVANQNELIQVLADKVGLDLDAVVRKAGHGPDCVN
jgi:hypothetical protein